MRTRTRRREERAGDALLALATASTPLDPPAITLRSSSHVYDQSNTSTCCAHAVAAAMECRMVDTNGINRDVAAVNPMDIFREAGHTRDLFESCDAAVRGIPSTNGVLHATVEELGPTSIERMVSRLAARIPLIVEIQVDTFFRDGYVPDSVYAPTGVLMAHAVCLVGYGVDTTTHQAFWLAKNSYGEQWGAGGFGRLARGGRVGAEHNVFALTSVQL